MAGSCKNCPDRVLGCHDHCPRYAADVAARKTVKEQERQYNIGYVQEMTRYCRQSRMHLGRQRTRRER